jgi:hypothetical protein
MPKIPFEAPPQKIKEVLGEEVYEYLLRMHRTLYGLAQDTGELDNENLSLASFDTDDLKEGSVNQYFTAARSSADFTTNHDAISGNHSSLAQSAARADSGATVTSANAGATYTSAEQTLINEIKGDVNTLVGEFNDLLAKLRTAKLLAT